MTTEHLNSPEFTRNLGFISAEEQKRLFSSRVAVAGAGGVGGLHILTLARLGIGRFTVADPDIFEAVNINRQFGALHSTIGRQKAEVLADMVKDINPRAEVRVLNCGVDSANVVDFLDGVDVFVDGIDFFEIETRRMIFARCRQKGIYALTAAPLGFGATLQTFAPDGMSFDTYFGIDDSLPHDEKIAAFAAGLAPHPFHISYMDLSRVSINKKTGPAVAPACTLAASLIATDVVKILTGKGEVVPVPGYLQFDMMLGKFRRRKLWMGGANPIQRLKRAIILKKIRAASQEV